MKDKECVLAFRGDLLLPSSGWFN